MVFVGRNLLAYLKVCIVGCSFLIMLLIVWEYLRSSCTMMPSSFACLFCVSKVLLMLSVRGFALLG